MMAELVGIVVAVVTVVVALELITREPALSASRLTIPSNRAGSGCSPPQTPPADPTT